MWIYQSTHRTLKIQWLACTVSLVVNKLVWHNKLYYSILHDSELNISYSRTHPFDLTWHNIKVIKRKDLKSNPSSHVHHADWICWYKSTSYSMYNTLMKWCVWGKNNQSRFQTEITDFHSNYWIITNIYESSDLNTRTTTSVFPWS